MKMSIGTLIGTLGAIHPRTVRKIDPKISMVIEKVTVDGGA